ncbi:MAG: DUF3267 domain-containing protein [Clostridia bacterium]|nr:DUF3267 domain-containing protein [Clostridia bacterium]
MRAVQQLPQGYVRILSIDLQKEKKLFLTINLIGLAIMAVLTIPMLFLVPISALFDMSNGLGPYFVRFVSLLVLIVVYMVLHELVHGITMKLCGTKRVKYGFTGAYAFAGSDDYYDKKSYIIIALAPVILWGIVLAIVTPLVPTPWFWVVYFIQICNLSGAAGDLYVTVKFARLPADILVKDDGVRMNVFSRQQ